MTGRETFTWDASVVAILPPPAIRELIVLTIASPALEPNRRSSIIGISMLWKVMSNWDT